MNYNATLCNTAWGKKLLAQVAKRTSFLKTVPVIFLGAVAKEGLLKRKTSF